MCGLSATRRHSFVSGHWRAPLAVLAVTTAASATLNGLGYGLGPPFGPTIALFYVATDERTRGRLRETAIVVLGLFAIHVGVTAITRGSGFRVHARLPYLPGKER